MDAESYFAFKDDEKKETVGQMLVMLIDTINKKIEVFYANLCDKLVFIF